MQARLEQVSVAQLELRLGLSPDRDGSTAVRFRQRELWGATRASTTSRAPRRQEVAPVEQAALHSVATQKCRD